MRPPNDYWPIFFAMILLVALTTHRALGAAAARDSLPDTSAVARINVIQAALDKDETWSRAWWYGWLGFTVATSTYAYWSAATAGNQGDRVVDVIAGVQGTVGIAVQLLTPFPSAFAQPRLRRMPSSTTEERGVKLAAAENYLRRSARAQRLGRTWVMHALNLAVNAAAALVLADGYGEWLKQSGHDPERTALWYVLAGTALGELQILTGPYRCIRAQKSYLGTYGDSRVPRLNLQFGPTCGGLGVKLAAEF